MRSDKLTSGLNGRGIKEKKSHKCGCGNTKDTQGYCDGSHEEEEL